MKFDAIVGNPPYSKTLHLQIIQNNLNSLNSCSDCNAVFVHPVRWLEDPLADYKQNSTKTRFANIANKIQLVDIIPSETAYSIFNAAFPTDLAIIKYNNVLPSTKFSILTSIQQSILNKVLKYCIINNIAQHIDYNKIDGIRIKCRLMMAGHPASITRSDRADLYHSTDEPLVEGYCSNSMFFTEKTSQMQGKTTLPMSIKFGTIAEAQNYLDSLKTNFMKNLCNITTWDVHPQWQFLPWMKDYTHLWTDELYCKVIELNTKEAAFMSAAFGSQENFV